jgi:myo-inositol-1(or 4)-monophosphatase
MYEALQGGGAFRNGKPMAATAAAALRGAGVAGPKPLIDRLDREVGGVRSLDKIPSLALRLARVAEGAVDIGLVSSNARDWDIAASDLILAEAGGRLTDFTGETPSYNQAEPIHGELVATSRGLHPRLIEAMTARRPQIAAQS